MIEPQDRRELIVSCAAELFARRSVAATTVREIADAVGVLSGSLYHHFESKDAIVEAVLSGYLELIRAQYRQAISSGKTPAERVHALVLASLKIAEDQPYPTLIYQNEIHYLSESPQFAAVQKAAEEVQNTWLKVIEAGVRDGSFRKDLPARTFYRLIRDAVWLSVRWHRPGGKYSTEQLADDVTSIFLSGYLSASTEARTAKAPASKAPVSKTARAAAKG
jgi:AcrR family transcriptional regulator